MVHDKLRGLPDFPPQLRTLVEHMILSHHGHLEFGSPKLPLFPEALLLHYLDDLDSKMECMRALIENDRQVEGCFTTYSPALERTALKKDRFLEDQPEGAQAARRRRPAAGETESAPAASPAAGPDAAAHPLAAPRPDSPFADKLKQALQTRQET